MAGMLDGRVVLVTGGTGGLGQGVVRVLRDEGARVVTTSHRPRVEAPEGVEVEQADLLASEDIAPLVERVLARHGRIDALVCLVGGFAGGSFIQTSEQTWRELVELNVASGVNVIRSALPSMTEQGYGRIVTIGSKPAIDPTPNQAAYAAAKASVIAYTASLARELRGTGVTANCVLPGTIDTPANRELLTKGNPDRWVRPEQIGRVVAFLCSEAAGVIRGAAIPVLGDG